MKRQFAAESIFMLATFHSDGNGKGSTEDGAPLLMQLWASVHRILTLIGPPANGQVLECVHGLHTTVLSHWIGDRLISFRLTDKETSALLLLGDETGVMLPVWLPATEAGRCLAPPQFDLAQSRPGSGIPFTSAKAKP